MNIAIDKTTIIETVRTILGDKCISFTEKSEFEFAFGTVESLNDSGWMGKWTETIRSEIAKVVPPSAVICVKPVPCGRLVYYRIAIGSK